MTTQKPGSESGVPATFGGAGFVPRRAGHTEELSEEGPWRPCGATSEVGPLEDVVVAWPSDRFAATPTEDPNTHLLLAWPDLDILRRQTQEVCSFFWARDIRVHLARPTTPPPPNHLFQRDLFFATRQGAILARMAAQQRAGEEPFVAGHLARLGIPILHTVRGTGTFEGADALWLNPQTVLVGTGQRTNQSGLDQVRGVLAEQGVDVISVELGDGVQHLLGVVTFIDADLALAHGVALTDPLRGVLGEHRVALEVVEPSEELLDRRGMNLVALGPRHVVMPAGCPALEARMLDLGVRVHTLHISEALKAGGGLACLTGILRRGDVGTAA